MILPMIYCLADSDLASASAVLRVWGPDANTFLQGQFTQDLLKPDAGVAYGLWLDQKGKVLADSHVLRLAENDRLIVSFSLPAARLLGRLQAYLIADDVELRDETANWSGFLLWGEGVAHLNPPAHGLALPSRRAGLAGRQWLVPLEQCAVVVAQLSNIPVIMSNRSAAELARLRAGFPAVPVDIGPRDLPNEGGLEEDAISYTKGCYLGQEVMARLKNLGQVRRRLHLVQGMGAPPEPGSLLYQGDLRVGETRSAAGDGESFLTLAMLSLAKLDPSAGLTRVPGSTPDLEILRRV
jgi:folate-binding protein YgfZ